jgi:hypothetical protein
MKNSNKSGFRVLIILLFFPFVISCGKHEKLNVYYCKINFDAQSCNDKCEIDKGNHLSFLVNREERSVLQVVYWDGVQEGSIVHKNCTIFENDSWDCSDQTEFPYNFWNTTTKMTKGIFSSYTEIRDKKSFKSRNQGEIICAKKF